MKEDLAIKMKIKVKIHPNSSQEKISKISKKEYIAWIKEKPIENKANISLIKLFKKELGLKIKIISGFTSKIKKIEILE